MKELRFVYDWRGVSEKLGIRAELFLGIVREMHAS